MPISPIKSFLIEMAPRGGFVEWTTEEDETYKLESLSPDQLSAITAILNGPNPYYDTDYYIFGTSNDNSGIHPSPIARNITEDYNT